MATKSLSFALTGAREGYSGELGQDPTLVFIDGVTHADLPEHEADVFTSWIFARWGAVPHEKPGNEGTDAQGASGEPSTNEGAVATDPEDGGEGYHIDERLRAVIHSLDPERDEHWTANGLPALAAVETLYGSGKLTRKHLDAAAPGFRRFS